MQLFETVQKKNEDLTEILKNLSEKVAVMQQAISSLDAMVAELNQCTETLKIRSSDVQVKNAEFIKCIDNVMKKLIELSQEQLATLSSKDIEEFEDGVDQLSLKAREVRAELEQQKQSHKEDQTEFQNLIVLTPDEDEPSLKYKEERMARINEIGERARTVLNQDSETQATKGYKIEENSLKFF